VRIAMFAGNVAWFGGLIRVIAEGVARSIAAIGPTADQQRTVALFIVGAILLASVESALLYRWSWYREMIRQTRGDIRSL
jgi:hypothetical protein